MIEPDDLLDYALRSILSEDQSEAHARRAVSAAYYALLHTIAKAGASLFSGNLRQQQRVARAYNHNALVRAAKKIDNPQTKSSGVFTPSDDLREIAKIFIELQQARETADYDLLSELSWSDADRLTWAALDACHRFQLIRGEAAVVDFLLEPLFPERNRG